MEQMTQRHPTIMQRGCSRADLQASAPKSDVTLPAQIKSAAIRRSCVKNLRTPARRTSPSTPTTTRRRGQGHRGRAARGIAPMVTPGTCRHISIHGRAGKNPRKSVLPAPEIQPDYIHAAILLCSTAVRSDARARINEKRSRAAARIVPSDSAIHRPRRHACGAYRARDRAGALAPVIPAGIHKSTPRPASRVVCMARSGDAAGAKA
jgi:hypothetical protein